jgi:F0F1-type ATP synthase membrane subunit a
MELSPMSNISLKFAFALFVVFVSLGASFARHGLGGNAKHANDNRF